MPLNGGKSLMQLMLERVSLLSKSVICAASNEHRFLVAEAIQAPKGLCTVLLESVPRNTPVVMAIAALVANPENCFCSAPRITTSPTL